MATKKLTPAQEASNKRESIKDAAALLGTFAPVLAFAEWLQDNKLLQGEDAMKLAEQFVTGGSSDRTKAAFQALIA